MSSLAEAIAQLPARVRGEMTARRLTYRDVARGAGVPLNTVHKLTVGAQDPRMSTLIKLAYWLEHLP